MKQYLTLLFIICLPLCSALADNVTPDAVIIGEVSNEVAVGNRAFRYQMVRIQSTISNKTKHTLKNYVIVARPANVPPIPNGPHKIFLGLHDGNIQKDAWYLIEHKRLNEKSYNHTIKADEK